MPNAQVYVFNYRDWECEILMLDDGTFWGSAVLPDTVRHCAIRDVISIPDAIVSLIETVNSMIDNEDDGDYDMNCQICGGCSVCGAYCTADGCACDYEDMDSIDDDEIIVDSGFEFHNF